MTLSTSGLRGDDEYGYAPEEDVEERTRREEELQTQGRTAKFESGQYQYELGYPAPEFQGLLQDLELEQGSAPKEPFGLA
jgi:hypothetical protein